MKLKAWTNVKQLIFQMGHQKQLNHSTTLNDCNIMHNHKRNSWAQSNNSMYYATRFDVTPILLIYECSKRNPMMERNGHLVLWIAQMVEGHPLSNITLSLNLVRSAHNLAAEL